MRKKLKWETEAADALRQELSHDLPVFLYDKTESTNKLAKEAALSGQKEALFLAAEQTCGRGRLGRSFYSPGGSGLYLSLLLRPELSPEQSLLITTAAAVAAANAVDELLSEEGYRESCGIKWVNDLYLRGKKVAGILAESQFSGEKTDFTVLGIGYNLTPPKDGFPAELANRAGALFERQHEDCRLRLALLTVNHFFKLYPSLEKEQFLGDYQKRSILTGREVTVIRGNENKTATVIGIDDAFRLTVRYPDGKIGHLFSGEVSLRL